MSEKVCNSLWRASAPVGPELSPLQGQMDVDVAIVGGGFTGLSAALHLAKSGVSVALLEAEEIGYGGSGRNVGLANAGLWLEPDTMDNVLGKEASRVLYDALAVAPDYIYGLIDEYHIQCEATRKGTLHAGVGKSGLAQLTRRYEQMERRGAPVQLLSSKEAQSRIGSRTFNSALFDPRAGTVQPLGYARGLAHAAQKEGARLFDYSPVQQVQPTEDGWLILTERGKVRSEKVILATNAYSSNGVKTQANKFVPICYSQLASEPLTETQLSQILPNKEGVWDTCTVMSSFRMDIRGRLIFGGMGKEGTILTNWASQRVKDLFPFLRGIKWEHSWTGTIAYSEDHLPHCEPLENGLYSICGYSGRGIGPGTIVGKELAELLTGQRKRLSIPMTPLRHIPGRELKRLFYEIGAHSYHLGQQAHVLR